MSTETTIDTGTNELLCTIHEAERLIRLTATADHREAVQAFIDKRKPVFKEN